MAPWWPVERGWGLAHAGNPFPGFMVAVGGGGGGWGAPPSPPGVLAAPGGGGWSLILGG